MPPPPIASEFCPQGFLIRNLHHVVCLWTPLSPPPSSLASVKLANPGLPGKWPLKWRRRDDGGGSGSPTGNFSHITPTAIPTLTFLQARCNFCRPANSVIALQAIRTHAHTFNINACNTVQYLKLVQMEKGPTTW